MCEQWELPAVGVFACLCVLIGFISGLSRLIASNVGVTAGSNKRKHLAYSAQIFPQSGALVNGGSAQQRC